jgi:DMSO/TMAO reductase YedYZ heme-binding membrane subunit
VNTSLLATIGGPKTLWYATRGTGVVSLILLTAIMCLGIAGVRRLRTERWPRFLVVGLHRNLALLAVAFIAMHVVTTVADGFAPIGLQDGVIPFASPYRPIWLGLGAVAFDLLLALTITSLLRARLGYRTWRALHWCAYGSWPIALVHTFGTGSDARVGWMQALGVISTAIVAAAVLARLVDGASWTGARSLAAAGVLLVPLGMLGWYVTGPGRGGWASRAGTPQRLLPHAAAAAAPVVASPAVSPRRPTASLPAPPFTAALRGRMSSTQAANGLVLVSIRGRTKRPAAGVLWIRLQGQAVEGGGVSMTASGASFGPASLPNQYLGKIVSLSGTRLVLALRGRSGQLALHVDLQIDGVSHLVTGTVAALGGAS